MSKSNSGYGLMHLILGILTAMIGKTIHGSTGWAILDFFFFPFAWIKWLICHEVTLTIIKKTFTWFFV
jgi:hypothetical protein